MDNTTESVDIKEDTENIQKPKKPRTQKQIEQFKTAQDIRVQKSKIKHQKIDEIKKEIKTKKIHEIITPPPPPPPPQSDTESEDEIVVKRRKPKKKAKKVVYLEETSSEDEAEPAPRAIRRKPTKTNTEPTPAQQQIVFF
jgi:hypothetical protein